MKHLLIAAFALLIAPLWIAPVAQAEENRIQRVISPGGIEAWLVEEHAIPMVAMEIGFSGGASLDPDGKEGAAYLAAGLVEEGAGDMDAQAFKRRLEDLNARMSFEASRDDFYVGMRALTENRDESFGLLRTALTDKNGIVPPARVLKAMGHPDLPSLEMPDWIDAWRAADAQRPWPPMQDPLA